MCVWKGTPGCKLKGLKNHQPSSSPCRPLPRQIPSSEASPLAQSPTALEPVPRGWGAARAAGRATPPLCSPRGHSPCVRGPAGGEGHPQGCEKVVGRPYSVRLIPPAGTHGWEVAPAGCSAKERVKRRALCGRLSAASGGAFQPLWYAKWLLFTAAAAAGGKGARRAGKRKPGAEKGKSAEVPTSTPHRTRAEQSCSRHPGFL